MVLGLFGMMTMLDISRWLGVGWDCVKGIVKEQLRKRYSKPNLSNLKYLAIDEISVRKGHKYLTLVMNLESGEVIFVGDGKGAEALTPFWEMLGSGQRKKIKAVSIDLGAAYILAVSQNLPKAQIVFDHFHVVKLMNEKLDGLRRNLFHEINDILEKKAVKGARWILLKKPENLNDKYNERQRLAEILTLNAPLATAYYMKEDLRQIWAQKDKASAGIVLQDWIKTAMNSGIKALVDMGRTIAKYRQGILNWYDHKISSGPLEGTNNKIKTLKRMAYGFRDLEFFKLRIKAIHLATYAFTG
jgi:transposase